MRALFLVLLFSVLENPRVRAADVLFVADEIPAMEYLSQRLQSESRLSSLVTDQGRMPKELGSFRAVVVYIHKDLEAAAERSFIDYANAGGRLVLLHHSISSGKRQNKDWFRFLGVALPEEDVDRGGYKWIEGVTAQWVDLSSTWVMTNQVKYSEAIAYPKENDTNRFASLPAFTLTGTEVYLNHVLTGPRTRLMGLKFTDPKTGKTWIQETAGWTRSSGQGRVVYFMPGHTVHDFEDSTYGRIVVNALAGPASAFP
jgi:hypothetical protein